MISCLLYRRRILARLDAGEPLEPALERHLEQCEACRRTHDAQLAIARGLARGARDQRRTPSPFLQSRIIAALERSPAPAPVRPNVGLLISAAAAAVALLLVLRAFHGMIAPRPALAAPQLSLVLNQAAGLGKNLPDTQKLEQWGTAVDLPLDKEMQSLLSDARGAAQSLVQNFVPDNLLSSLDTLPPRQ